MTNNFLSRSLVLSFRFIREAESERVVEISLKNCAITWQLPAGMLRPADEVKYIFSGAASPVAGERTNRRDSHQKILFLHDGGLLWVNGKTQQGFAYSDDIFSATVKPHIYISISINKCKVSVEKFEYRTVECMQEYCYFLPCLPFF